MDNIQVTPHNEMKYFTSQKKNGMYIVFTVIQINGGTNYAIYICAYL